MKIVILGFGKIKYMPYLRFYLDQLDSGRDEIHLVYWKRDNLPDTPLPEGVICHALERPMTDSTPLWRKVPNFWRYRCLAKKVIRRVRPDRLVVLQSTTAFTVYDLLVRRYKGRYALSYLDVTYEYHAMYRRMVRNLVLKSAVTYTSSDGFRLFLPDSENLVTTHNITTAYIGNKDAYHSRRCKHTPIRVAFWGIIRHPHINETIIRRLGNDPRFELHYYGRAQGSMLALLQQSVAAYSNVFYHGEYLPEDRPAIAAQMDIIHNIYFESEGCPMSFAMSNKYYDGLLFGIPQLCMHHSLMGNLCDSTGVGFSCDPREENFADALYDYYQRLDLSAFLLNCDRELDRVVRQMDHRHPFFDRPTNE